MPHTNYDYISVRPFREGQIATAVPKVSRFALNNTGAVIPFGRVVVLGDSESTLKLPSATGQFVLGVAFLNYIYENTVNANDDSGYPDDKQVDYLCQGEIAVFVEEAVTIGDPVYFRHTANGAGKLIVGRFRNDADTNTCDLLANARWTKGASANSLAVLALNLP